MTTINELITELNKFEQGLTVEGAEALTVAVTTQTAVLAPPAPAEEVVPA